MEHINVSHPTDFLVSDDKHVTRYLMVRFIGISGGPAEETGCHWTATMHERTTG